MPRPKVDEAKCLTPECHNRYAGGKGGGRGLCKKCHDAAFYLVQTGKTTWEELERLGLAIPVYQTNFEKQLAVRREEQRNNNLPGKPLHEM